MDVQGETFSEDQEQVKTVVIVEDDVAMGALLVEVIQSETSYRAFLARNAREALDLVKTIQPALFVLNSLLPGMNGIKLFERLESMDHLKGTPTLFLNSDPPFRAFHNCRVAVLNMPFDLTAFLDTLKQLVVH